MEIENVHMDSDTSSALPENTTIRLDPIVTYVEEAFSKAKTSRRVDEERWMRAYRNYRGLYGPDMQFTSTEKSRIFVKVTKTKVLAAYGQVIDVLFGSSKFPLSIDPTTLPEGVAESVHINLDPNAPPEVTAATPPKPYIIGKENELKPGDTMSDITSRLGALKSKLAPISDKVIEGPGTTSASVTFSPAFVAAKKMEKKIHDQLEESNANKHLRSSVFEQVLFGTGIMKGPFALNKEYPDWDENGNYKPLKKTVPSTTFVSCWNFYPDPDGTNMDDVEYVIERHKMSRSKLNALKKRPFFRKKEIDECVRQGESYVEAWWETQMKDNQINPLPTRFEVLEYWGFIDRHTLEEDLNFKIPSELSGKEQLNMNVWVCNGEVIRLVLNPFTPMRIPFQAAPFEFNPYSFFGIGIAENMDDTQTLMNGFMRLAADNAILSGNLVFEIDEDALVPGQDLSIYPGKVFRRQGGAPGQALFGTSFPNVSQENLQLFNKARELADESTGFPSFAYGQTGVQGGGRTASGISMIMSAANGSIRTVIKNIDDYLLAPLGKALFAFNMQFDFDESIRGDLEVKARGTESLMAKEVRSQRLMQFLDIVSTNPALAPFAKMDYIIREFARAVELDPDKVTNNLADAAVMAEVMKKFNPQPQPAPAGPPTGLPGAPPAGQPPLGAPQGAPQPPQAPTGGPTLAQDSSGSGGGTIGTGTVPIPNEQGFSGAKP